MPKGLARVVFHSSGILLKEGVAEPSSTVLSFSSSSRSFYPLFPFFSVFREMSRVGHHKNLRVYKQLDRDFRTKHKVFIFRLDDSGGKIIIIERSRFNNFVVELDHLGGGGVIGYVR